MSPLRQSMVDAPSAASRATMAVSYRPHRQVPGWLFAHPRTSQPLSGEHMQRLRETAPQAVPSLGKVAQALWKKDWVVYAKTPLGGAAQVLQYLSRTTHRTAIGNERILSLQGNEVVISARAKRSEGQENFMARVARVNIQQCPVCQQGRLGVVQTLARAKHLPDPFEGSARKANSRVARLRRSRTGKHVAVAAQQTGTVARKRLLQAPSQAIMTSHGGGCNHQSPILLIPTPAPLLRFSSTWFIYRE